MHDGIEQICISADEAKNGVDIQHSQTEGIRNSIEEMVTNSLRVSGQATEANETAKHAMAQAEKADKVVNETIRYITDLADAVSNASKSISDLENETNHIGGVLDVIGTISEQTNLLALNAAIEAARAGEQGRGFAVVADEVRSLAQRTKESTTEIQSMIDKLKQVTSVSVDSMSHGEGFAAQSTNTIQETGTVINDIQSAIQSISVINENINHQTASQADQVAKIDGNMDKIHEISEDSKHRADSTLQRSTSLSKLAEKLENLISEFKL